MKFNKKIAILTTVTVLAVAAIGTTWALFTDSGEVTNVITMGNVGITLTEPIFSQNNENNTIQGVMPNQTIQKDPTITVEEDSRDTYIRAKVEITGDLDESHVNDLSEAVDAAVEAETNWEKSEDGYFYYRPDTSIETNNKLTAGDEVKLFQSIKIPDNWENEIENLSFQINITAYAIQADNFEPGYDEGGIYGWYNSTGAAL